MKKISIIAAVAHHNAIGYKQELLCYLPADLKHFKELTSGHAIIMGRKTFESLPKGALPNRHNIVLTRDKLLQFTGCTTVTTMQEAIIAAEEDSELFIIGGASVYQEALAFANRIYLTLIDHQFEQADTFFPKWDEAVWCEVERKTFKADEKNRYDFSFITLERTP